MSDSQLLDPKISYNQGNDLERINIPGKPLEKPEVPGKPIEEPSNPGKHLNS